MCKKTEREADGGRGECARRQRERRMDGVVSVQEDRERGGWRERGVCKKTGREEDG